MKDINSGINLNKTKTVPKILARASLFFSSIFIASFIAIFIAQDLLADLAVGFLIFSLAGIGWISVTLSIYRGEIRDKSGLVLSRSAHPLRFWLVWSFFLMLFAIIPSCLSAGVFISLFRHF